MAGTIWTIGHWTCPEEVVLETLGSAGIDELVDVRRLPGSRRSPQVKQTAHDLGIRHITTGLRLFHHKRAGYPQVDRAPGCSRRNVCHT